VSGGAAPELLYHYTCTHAALDIEREGVLKPHAHPWLQQRYGPVVWLTDISDAALAGVAIGVKPQITLSCDRTEVCYPIWSGSVEGLVWWPHIRDLFDPSAASAIEAGAMPAHWWLTRKPIKLEDFA
jgi:hypothetical protein